MKRMNLRKEILVIVMIIVAMLTISSKVLATGTSDNPIQIPTINAVTTPDTNTEANEVVPTTNNIAPTTNTEGSNYQNTTTLPQTGDASDYAIFMLIVVAGIVAVFAYKKVREYNIK